MKVCVVVLAVFVTIALARPDDKYTIKYDNIDLDEILTSDRLLQNYVNCLLDKGSCTPDGTELKGVLKDALETECTKCSDKQKEGSKKVIRYLIKNKPDMWNELQAKLDPDNKYVNKYEAELKAEGLIV